MRAAAVVKLRPRQILEQHRAEIEVMCAAGCAWDDIADLTGVGRPTVISWAESEGIVKNNKPKPVVRRRHRAALTWTDERDAKLLGLVEDQLSFGNMAMRMGVSITSIRVRLTLLGRMERTRHIDTMPLKPKPASKIAILPTYDFRAWSKGAQLAQGFIYWIGDIPADNERLGRLIAAMDADDTVMRTKGLNEQRWCIKTTNNRHIWEQSA